MPAKKTVFICQVTEDTLKIIRCLYSNHSKIESVETRVEAVSKISQVLKDLNYKQQPIIISLPRAQATCRYLKIPSRIPNEIERIIKLQASSYLPYPASDLITGYQVISTDKEGYTHINLVIVYRDIIERYMKIFKELKIPAFNIALSSYGLANLYNQARPEENGTVMVVNINGTEAELAVVSRKKLVFSRSFKLNKDSPGWENAFIGEVNKTRDAYLKEIPEETPAKIAIFENEHVSEESFNNISRQLTIPVEKISYAEKNYGSSTAMLVGLGLGAIPESASLLPSNIKEAAAKNIRNRERLRIIAFFLSIILILGVTIAKSLNNKALYLNQLRAELSRVEKEAKPLEEIEKRMQFMQKQAQRGIVALDLLHDLYQVMPEGVSLANFIYEEEGLVILRGQTMELNPVFTLVKQLEKSKVFKKFNIKIKYAAKRRFSGGEIVDFEIDCVKK